MNKIVIVVAGLVVVAGGVYLSMNNDKGEMMDKEMKDKEMMNDSIVMEKKEGEMMKEEMKKEDDIMKEAVVMMKGSYEAYSSEKIAMAETGDVVLFFHASWCPSCRGLNSDIEANMSSIPEGVTILKVDYDKETELKKKYGVTTQHTLVQVDKNGNLIKKWSGGSSLSNLVSEIE